MDGLGRLCGETTGMGEGAARGATAFQLGSGTGAARSSGGLDDHLSFLPILAKYQKAKGKRLGRYRVGIETAPLASPCAATVSGLGAPD